MEDTPQTLADEFDRRLSSGADPYQILHEILRGGHWSGAAAREWEGEHRGGFLFLRLIDPS